MTRTLLAFSMITAILAAVFTAQAQTTARVYRVGWITPWSIAEFTGDSNPRFNTFRQEMRQRGHVEGENLIFELRSVEARPERISEVVGELIRLNVDVIVAVAQPTVQAAQQATTKIPIVMFGVGDPVATGIVASLARPGGNITGLSQLSPELSGKRLELLKEVLPGVSRVAVLWNPTNPVWQAAALKETEGAARALGLRLQLQEARGPDQLEAAFAAMTREHAGALFVPADIILVRHAQQIAALAARHGLPAMYGFREHVEAGGLMSYAANFAVMYRRAAVYVDKILKGAKPADLPVEQPTKFELVINRKTAKALGLTIPLLQRADQVIE